MPNIHVLEKDVFELIAAGEVIERPASIVKELVENSIDAHANHIQVEIKNGGKKLIRVTDNGCGISSEDCPKAFLRHATSKVATQTDLEHISTLGFRGEALASVCAVSKVELRTRCAENDMGVCYRIEGGEQVLFEASGCALGTSMTVEDIFYNVPARMKFLKRDATEASAIHDIIDKLALSHADIAFTFKKDGKIVSQTPGNNNLMDTIYAIFGRSFSDALMPVQYQTNDIAVSGFVSLPMQCRPNRSMQYFFINGRYVLSKTCRVGLEEGYKGSVMTGKFPACVLYLTIPSHQIDINVHPAKIEVRFSDEHAVLQAIYTAIKAAISQHNQLPTTAAPKPHTTRNDPTDDKSPTAVPSRIPLKQKPSVRSSNTSSLASAVTEYSIGNKDPFAKHPFLSSSNVALGKKNSSRARIQDQQLHLPQKDSSVPSQENGESSILPDETSVQKETKQPPEPSHQQTIGKTAEPVRIIGELFRTYILAESGDYFIIVDKHAAHERILYEKLKAEKASINRQSLVQPVLITLSRREYECALDNSEKLYQFGFGAEDFGNCTIVLREIPVILESFDFKQAFMDLVKNLADGKQDLSPNAIDKIYHTMACRSAVKGNDTNSPQELQALFDQVYHDEKIRTCPHGRPVVLTFHKERFAKRFGRI